MHDFSFENRSYLGEFEAEFKKALARESGAQGVLFDEKKVEIRKSRDTVPLSRIFALKSLSIYLHIFILYRYTYTDIHLYTGSVHKCCRGN
jgi:hypothetical protein